MKWMGGWSERDFDTASADLIDEIGQMMVEEYERNDPRKDWIEEG